MPNYLLRIITDSCSPSVEDELNRFFLALPEIQDFRTELLAPYWKIPDRGEVLCAFACSQSLSEIQPFFASCWEGSVADARWSHIHVPHAIFLWLDDSTDIV